MHKLKIHSSAGKNRKTLFFMFMTFGCHFGHTSPQNWVKFADFSVMHCFWSFFVGSADVNMMQNHISKVNMFFFDFFRTRIYLKGRLPSLSPGFAQHEKNE